MNRQFLIVFLMLFSVVSIKAQRIDSLAVYVLNSTSNVIGNLNGFGVSIETTYDVLAQNIGHVKKSNAHVIKVKGSKKFLLDSKGDKGTKKYFLSEEKLHYYSQDTNNYGVIDSPGTIMDMVNMVNDKYGIELPGVDFWYPTFTQDLIAEFSNINYLGTTTVEGLECFHIVANNEDYSVQFWITKNEFFLPKKMVVTYLSAAFSPQYQLIFSNWEVNATFPDAIFDFTPPPGAHKITIKEKQ
jgi:hypothetical protein